MVKSYQLITLIITFVLLAPQVFAICSDGQIDINSATEKELQKLTGIGPAYSERIIESRPFGTIDELINVKGIGTKTLEKIKEQNKACVSSGITSENQKGVISENEQTLQAIETILEDERPSLEASKNIEEIPTESVIKLSKQKNNGESKKEKVVYESKTEKIRKYSIYGFSALLIVILFLIIKK